MSNILTNIKKNAEQNPDRIMYVTTYLGEEGELQLEKLRWRELEKDSNCLANYFSLNLKTKTPVVVFGHKSMYMPIAFLACVKSGRAYVPVDSSFPAGRVQDILDAVEPELVVAVDDLPEVNCAGMIMNRDALLKAIEENSPLEDSSLWVKPEDIHYIIFTSGSTGAPKGVQITSQCLDNFLKWAVKLSPTDSLQEGHHTYINQAPFSFDLSVFDLYLVLYTGGTLWTIPKALQGNMQALYTSLGMSNADVWVSTPSFAEIALSDDKFRDTLLPKMRLFLFCGETLTNQTVSKLNEIFPDAQVVNTYGPTESTVAMTSVCVTPEIRNRYNPLPIGVPKEGTNVYIMDEKGNVLPEGEKGEIVIAGDTVSVGYWKNEEKTQSVFGIMVVDGKRYRLYHTHDKGYYRDGLLFYCGRIDLQIKLHGYRIELEDIESNILRTSNVEQAVILPEFVDGEVVSLTAYIVVRTAIESALKERKRIREELKMRIPEYMIPKKFVFVESLPVTTNGKVDRKKLEGMRNADSGTI